jgi:hypothetical protein
MKKKGMMDRSKKREEIEKFIYIYIYIYIFKKRKKKKTYIRYSDCA